MEISKSTVGIDENQEPDIKEWSSTNDFYNFREADNKDVFLLAVSKGYELFEKETQISIKGGGYFRMTCPQNLVQPKLKFSIPQYHSEC